MCVFVGLVIPCLAASLAGHYQQLSAGMKRHNSLYPRLKIGNLGCITKEGKKFEESRDAGKNIHLMVEQHGFELHQSTYMGFFFNIVSPWPFISVGFISVDSINHESKQYFLFKKIVLNLLG